MKNQTKYTEPPAGDGQIDIICVGNAMTDIFARGDAAAGAALAALSALEPGGGAKHISIERMGEILAPLSGFSRASGGGAANVAKIASLLGNRAAFAGAVGNDDNGDFFETSLKAAGVLPLLARKPRPTGVFLKLALPGGAERIAAAPSAALELREEDIPEGAFETARAVVLDGYLLERTPLARRVLELAHKHGVFSALDAGSPALAGALAHEILAYARLYEIILFMNEEEAFAFFKALNPQEGEDDGDKKGGPARETPALFEFFKALTMGDVYPVIAVKQGKRGSVVFAGGELYRAQTLPVIPRESTGAGDAYCAGFLTAWLHDLPLRDCAVFANKTARETLDAPGSAADPTRLRRLGAQLRR